MTAPPSQLMVPRARNPLRVRWGWIVAFFAVFFVLPPGALVGAYFAYAWSHPAGCEERERLARAMSPDGAWVATVYDNWWTDGGFVTEIFATVEITRPDEKTSSCPSTGTVLAMDAVPTVGPIAVRWTAPRTLDISIPKNEQIGKQEPAYADVAISYRYAADDPVEAACWKRWQALPGGEGAKLQKGSDGIVDAEAFLAKCRAEIGAR
jgi:hypothetical protein